MTDWAVMLHRFDPVVSKKWLLVLAGLMWAAVGVMLSSLAFGWLTADPSWGMLLLGSVGILLAIAVYRFGFVKIARKNIARIWNGAERACLFSFQAWKSYLLILVMMTMGILLRNSPLPKPYLAVLYSTIGGALFISSFHYFAHIYRKM